MTTTGRDPLPPFTFPAGKQQLILTVAPNIAQVMEEIIAKSKKYKAEKAKQKDADYDATEALDRELAELMRGRALQGLIRPKRAKPKFQEPVAGEDAAFDVARRELVFESKAKVRIWGKQRKGGRKNCSSGLSVEGGGGEF